MCGENAGHFTKYCKYNKMARELKEKDEAAKKAVKHPTMFSITPVEKW